MGPRDKPLRFRVIPSEAGQTLQVLLARRVPEFNRTDAASAVKAGGVYVNKLRIRVPTIRVAEGERVTVYPDAANTPELDPATLVFAHRDDDFVVLDKPPGVPVAQTRRTSRGTLAEALRRRLETEGVTRPYVGVVHRLDQGASGLVLFTVRGVANKSIHQQFVEHRIARRYRLASPTEGPEDAICEAPLLVGRTTVQVAPADHPKGVRAVTSFRCIGRNEAGEWLYDAELETGRTHQIRAHAAHLGIALAGDQRYGEGASRKRARGVGSLPEETDDPDRLHLHARELVFEHPRTGAPISVASDLPAWGRPVG